jgi:hypothetical protein
MDFVGAQNTYYDTKMLIKVVFDNTAFVKLKFKTKH